MKERGKAVVEVYNDDDISSTSLNHNNINNNNIDHHHHFFQDYTTSCDVLQCKKHPQSSSAGVCAYCLKDRLINLVCSDCGEQRFSSCSCSEISSNPRTSCAGDVGSVGRVSFLIENDNNKDNNPVLPNYPNPKPKPKPKGGDQQEVLLLKRSNSSCVEIKKKNGFWKIGRLFRKKRSEDKDVNNCAKSVGGGGVDDKGGDVWVVDYMGVSRSRSLCSFRGGGILGSEDGSDLMNFSGARSSISAARSSGVNGGLFFDPERKSGFSEPEPRRSGFGFDCERRDSAFMESDLATMRKFAAVGGGGGGGFLDVDGGFGGGGGASRRVFSLKESYFTGGDDSGFIDLKFDSQAESTPAVKKGVLSAFGSVRDGGEYMSRASNSIENGLVGDGGSFRMSMEERGIKKSRKSFKGWRWIFKAPSNSNSNSKLDHSFSGKEK